MNFANFAQQLAAVRQRARRLIQQVSGTPALSDSTLPAAIGELDEALAVLQDAGQRMRQHAEALRRERDAVEAERERYRALFEFAPDGYLITDARGRIYEANWAAGILLNIPEDDLAGAHLSQFVAPDEAEAFQSEMSRLDNVDGVREWETRLQARNYAAFDAAVTVVPARDSQGRVTALRWLVRDITARKQAAAQVSALNAELEQRVRERTAQLEAANRDLRAQIEERQRAEAALRQSEERFSTAFRASPDGLVISRLADGLILEINDSWAALYGVDPAEVVGKASLLSEQYFSPEAREAAMRRLETDGYLRDFETLIRHASGAERYVRLSAERIVLNGEPSVLMIMRDVTSRRQAQEAVRARARQQAAVAELGQRALGGLPLAALLDETVSLVARTLHVPFADVLELLPDGRAFVRRAGHGWPATGSLVTVPAGPNAQASYVLAAQAPVIVDDLEAETRFQPLPLCANHGIISCLSAPITDRGRPLGVLNAYAAQREAFSTDDANFLLAVANVLTAAIERSRSEAEIRSLNAGLERRVAQRTSELQAKNRELETFTYSVSHDLKAPLRGIDGYSRILLEEYAHQLDDDGRAALITIRGAVQHMNQLIDDLLAYSRLERRALTPGPVNLQRLVSELLAERGEDLQRRGITVRVDLGCEVVSADADGLALALRNLIDNAVKFTRHVPEPRIEIEARPEGDVCVVAVRDNGIGFDMQYHDRIFGIFQRLHRAEDYPGTGIGLAIVQKAASRMNGRVWAESAAGQGACFYLEIPVREAAPA